MARRNNVRTLRWASSSRTLARRNSSMRNRMLLVQKSSIETVHNWMVCVNWAMHAVKCVTGQVVSRTTLVGKTRSCSRSLSRAIRIRLLRNHSSNLTRFCSENQQSVAGSKVNFCREIGAARLADLAEATAKYFNGNNNNNNSRAQFRWRQIWVKREIYKLLNAREGQFYSRRSLLCCCSISATLAIHNLLV